MSTITQKSKTTNTEELKIKAALFDQIIEFIEDTCLGHLMKEAEKERNIPLARARKLLR